MAELILPAAVLVRAAGIPRARADLWAAPLSAACERFDIANPARLSAFLAQVGHESQGFTFTRENLYYTTAARLLAVFGSSSIPARRRVTAANVRQFLRNPEGLANFVYAGRYGNGPASSGDGFRYRGGGLIHLTFRANYRACGAGIGIDLEATPERIVEPAVAALSAAWFWLHGSGRNLNLLADRGQFGVITKAINGGTNGAEDRERRYAAARSALGIA
jgi:putative chitinase